MNPPTEAISREMSWADRRAVPLKRRCSTKVGNSVEGSRFTPGPHPNPEIDRHRGGPRVFQNQHLQPVGQARHPPIRPSRPSRKPHPEQNNPKK